MSYAVSHALQAAVYARLTSDETLLGLVGDAIYDMVPPGELPVTYVTLGPERVQDASDISSWGAIHRFTVSVVTSEAGFRAAKEVAGAVSDVLHGADLTLSEGRLVSLTFQSGRALRIRKNAARRIDLTYRARLDAA